MGMVLAQACRLDQTAQAAVQLAVMALVAGPLAFPEALAAFAPADYWTLHAESADR